MVETDSQTEKVTVNLLRCNLWLCMLLFLISFEKSLVLLNLEPIYFLLKLYICTVILAFNFDLLAIITIIIIIFVIMI